MLKGLANGIFVQVETAQCVHDTRRDTRPHCQVTSQLGGEGVGPGGKVIGRWSWVWQRSDPMSICCQDFDKLPRLKRDPALSQHGPAASSLSR